MLRYYNINIYTMYIYKKSYKTHIVLCGTFIFKKHGNLQIDIYFPNYLFNKVEYFLF